MLGSVAFCFRAVIGLRAVPELGGNRFNRYSHSGLNRMSTRTLMSPPCNGSSATSQSSWARHHASGPRAPRPPAAPRISRIPLSHLSRCWGKHGFNRITLGLALFLCMHAEHVLLSIRGYLPTALLHRLAVRECALGMHGTCVPCRQPCSSRVVREAACSGIPTNDLLSKHLRITSFSGLQFLLTGFTQAVEQAMGVLQWRTLGPSVACTPLQHSASRLPPASRSLIMFCKTSEQHVSHS
jgi:hypothetical protein